MNSRHGLCGYIWNLIHRNINLCHVISSVAIQHRTPWRTCIGRNYSLSCVMVFSGAGSLAQGHICPWANDKTYMLCTASYGSDARGFWEPDGRKRWSLAQSASQYLFTVCFVDAEISPLYDVFSRYCSTVSPAAHACGLGQLTWSCWLVHSLWNILSQMLDSNYHRTGNYWISLILNHHNLNFYFTTGR